ncbi:MAG: tRNA pseudouridine65 synthase [Myxococcota bacterium]|jgi:tRNA pseudouridine65 synthase
MSQTLAMEPHVLGRIGGVWAIAKPAGLRVHPADDDGQPDLTGWLAGQAGLPAGLAPVHRIDAQTSGIVLCAATAAERREASEWFAEGRVQKHYLALVYGRTRKKGIIRRPLQDGRRGRPLEAMTRYRLWEGLGELSLLEVCPETGRKHQIRRHLHGIGHPIVGDTRYRSRRSRTPPDAPERLWLHAAVLHLPTGDTVTAPLPDELADHLDTLRDQ